jgi:hypothetical protein
LQSFWAIGQGTGFYAAGAVKWLRKMQPISDNGSLVMKSIGMSLSMKIASREISK